MESQAVFQAKTQAKKFSIELRPRDMMDEAAALGHVGARVRIAWAKFAGTRSIF